MDGRTHAWVCFFLAVLVSVSKDQISVRIKPLRLRSIHKSGKLICMSKIICSQAGIQSTVNDFLSTASCEGCVLKEGERIETNQVVKKKNKGCIFLTTPCWVTC